MDIIFINTHPIQYFAPLYQQMARDSDLQLTVLYLSSETVAGYRDSEFGVNVNWDIPLLTGYNHAFVRNNSWKAGIKNGFFGLVNFGVIGALRKQSRNTMVVIHGWSHFSLVLSIWAAWFCRLHVCIRGESPLKHENFKVSPKSWLRRLFRNALIFPFVDSFLYIGSQNRKFYEACGIPDRKLHFTPYSVDNERFRRSYLELSQRRDTFRAKIGIPNNVLVVLYAGKYIPKKRPMDLLHVIAHHPDLSFFLVMVGDGELRPQMETFVDENRLRHKILLTGFINQSAIAGYYAIADLFVMCSGQGETWGLSVNEAMNFNLPLLISDLTGCAEDLVKPGENGYIFATGNKDEIASHIRRFAAMSQHDRARMGQCSADIVQGYSFQNIIAALKQVGNA
ncbi:MAG TPA: glycosyltransferase family 4 protein [Cyclobacteriaceae bacterium]|nr:glycosyltransferase family 4 protein [Cyclobacteriaceae bacterium]